MRRTATIKFGDSEYVVPQLTIGQLEDLLEYPVDKDGNYVDEKGNALGPAEQAKCKLDSLQVLMRRAEPEIPDVRDLECTWDEINSAIVAIYALSSVKRDAPEGESQAEA